jgi:hypothetical protein
MQAKLWSEQTRIRNLVTVSTFYIKIIEEIVNKQLKPPHHNYCQHYSPAKSTLS